MYIGSQSILAVIDMGSQISLLSEELYYKSKSEGVKSLELGEQNAVLISAFGNKSKRIRMQAMMPVDIDGMMMDHIFLISPQLLTQAILGVDFCRRNNIVIHFPEQYLTKERMVRCQGIHLCMIRTFNSQAQVTLVKLTTALRQD